MGRKIDPVVVERRPLHGHLAGIASEMEVAGRGAELTGHCIEFFSGVEKRRQILASSARLMPTRCQKSP